MKYCFIHGWWFLLTVFMSCVDADQSKKLYSLDIKKQNSEIVSFDVHLADTYEERKMGLMFVKELPRNQGMLFIYEKEQKVSMWMKNTVIPLDMVFISESGLITQIVKRDDVLSTRSSISKQPVKYVLEINLGETKKQGIQINDQISFSY